MDYTQYWNRWSDRRKLFFFEGEGGGAGGGGEDKKVEPAKTLKEAIERAAETPKKEEDKKDDKKEDEPTEEEIKELEQARNLLNVLKDPVARKALIENLAEKEGITKGSTKEEKKEAVRNLETIIKEGLGEEYEVLGSRLHKILKEALELHTKETVDPIKTNLAEKERLAIRNEASTAYDKVFAEYSNSKELEAEVAALAKEVPVGNQPPDKYFKRLLIMAADEKGISLKKVSVKDSTILNFDKNRRDLNRKDASSRIASEGADDKEVKAAPKPMNLNEAIAAGAKAAEALFKK